MDQVQNSEKQIVLPTKQYEDILFHVYRSHDKEPDLEGMLAPFALALFLKFQIETCEGPWKKPNIFFGADLRDISDGVPLYQIYSNQFLKELEYLGISDCCHVITPDVLDHHPIDTLSEIDAFQFYRWVEERENCSTALCFSREPHQDRIKYLCDEHLITSDFLSVEQVIREILSTEDLTKEEIMERYFPDTQSFKKAESLKMLFMLLVDRKGRVLEFISRFAKFKNLLLNAGGHTS